MKIKADFHIHTHHSPDSGSSASSIVQAARKEGIDVIAVTDHNTTKGALEVKAIAKGNPLVLVGQEVKTLSGEIIVIGPEKDIPKKLSLAETCRLAKSMGGFIISPHPFDRYRNGIGRRINVIIGDIDAIEALNSRCFRNKYNKKAATFAEVNEIPVVSGSDAHFPEEIGKSFTQLDINKIKLDERSILDAITSGNTELHGGLSGLYPHIRTFFRRFS
jgi:predicted metal-dependent phosphoesterase TrpH